MVKPRYGYNFHIITQRDCVLLYQIDGGYCYNSDSILLYGFISSFSPQGRTLDVGIGCGIVGLLTARDYDIALEGIEKQSAYIEIAKRNAHVNHIDYIVHEGDFSHFKDEDKFDWIISNPPFYHEGSSRSENPILHAARYNIHLPIDVFARQIAKLLKPKGQVAVCYDARQFVSLCSAFEDAGLRVVDVQFVHSKRDRSSTLVMVHAKKNSKAITNVLPPLITFEDEKYTPAVQAIYDKAKVHSIKCPM